MSEDRDGLLCLGTCGGSRNNNAWMCDDCWKQDKHCSFCGVDIIASDILHSRKPCPNPKEKEKTMKTEDFENEDWFKFLPPSLQEEAVTFINSKVPSGVSSDPEHNCIENIDCCDAFDYAKEQGCNRFKDYHTSDDCDHSDCHEDCYSSDMLQEQLDELKENIKNFIDEQ